MDRVKEDLIFLYQHWEKLNVLILDKLDVVEESAVKMRDVEEGLGDVCVFLKTEVNQLMERVTNPDSGISDASDQRLDKEIKTKERTLAGVQTSLFDVQKTFPASSSHMESVVTALKESKAQISDLNTIVRVRKRSGNVQVVPTKSKNAFVTRFFKIWKLMSSFLFFIFLFSILFSPNCCEHSNSLYLLIPGISYSNGLRPI